MCFCFWRFPFGWKGVEVSLSELHGLTGGYDLDLLRVMLSANKHRWYPRHLGPYLVPARLAGGGFGLKSEPEAASRH